MPTVQLIQQRVTRFAETREGADEIAAIMTSLGMKNVTVKPAGNFWTVRGVGPMEAIVNIISLTIVD